MLRASVVSAVISTLAASGLALAACNSDPPSGGSSSSSSSGGSAGTGRDASPSVEPPEDGGVVDGGGDAGAPLECFDFSNDPNTPLALDGTFTTQTERWARPHDDTPVCPATALLPPSAAEVPRVVYAFCNNDAVPHKYMVEMLAQAGPKGEAALDDPYLVLYSGLGVPADAKQCLAINDDIPDSLGTKDAEITEVTVPPGGKITVVGTTVTFDPSDGTGQGYYVLVVTNVD